MNSRVLQVLLLITSVLILIFVLNERIIKRRQEKITSVDTSIALCPPTVSDTEGPFYLSGIPYSNKLSPPNATGERLIVIGKVTTTDCVTTLENVFLDIWHAGPNGEYDDNWYRGKVKTDEEGNYQFETILPGQYSSGVILRLPHIHFKVVKDGKAILTSQMYLRQSGDADKSQFVDLVRKDTALTGTFNIIVKP